MTTREQLTHERVEAIIDRLEDSAVLDADMAEALRMTENLDQSREAIDLKRDGMDPREATGRE